MLMLLMCVGIKMRCQYVVNNTHLAAARTCRVFLIFQFLIFIEQQSRTRTRHSDFNESQEGEGGIDGKAWQ
jgi:hypothetical protein